MRLYIRYNVSEHVAGTRVKIRRWGSSLGVVIPMEVARRLHLEPGDDVFLDVQRSSGVIEAFGSLRDWKVDTQKLKNELRRGW